VKLTSIAACGVHNALRWRILMGAPYPRLCEYAQQGVCNLLDQQWLLVFTLCTTKLAWITGRGTIRARDAVE